MESRIYRIGDVLFQTGKYPSVMKNGVALTTSGDRALRLPDLKVLQHMLTESHKHLQDFREFSPNELWSAGWPDKARSGNTPESNIKTSVQGSVSRLRFNFPGILPKEGYRLLLDVEDVTPTDIPLLVAHRILIGCIVTAASTVLVDAPARAVLAAFRVTLTEPLTLPRNIRFMLGTFQGIVGALAYSIPICSALLFLWFVLYKCAPRESRFSKLLSCLAGMLSGLLAGTALSILIIRLQNIETLHAAGWVPIKSANFLDAFIVTKLGYAMPWFGAFVGGAVAFTVLWIVGLKEWKDFLSRHSKLTNPRVLLTVVSGLFTIALKWSFLVVIPAMLLSAVIFCKLVSTPLPVARIIGESMVIAMGGVGFVNGMLVSLYLLTRGADIVGDPKCSLST